MGIAEFRILGISGGAPYALAAAWALPERVRAIAVVSGAPPLAELADRSGLLALYRWLLFFYPRHRELLRFSFHAVRPFLSVKVPIRFRPLAPQASPALRRQRDARHRRVRSLLRKPAPGVARLGRWSDGRRRDLRAAVGVSARGNPRAGSTLARSERSQLSLEAGPIPGQAPPSLRRASGRRTRGTIRCPFVTCTRFSHDLKSA